MKFILFLCFAGLLVGTLLAKLCKEEIPKGKKYFNIIMRGCLALVGIKIMYNFKISLTVILGIIVGYFVSMLDYLVLGAALVLLLEPVTSGLIFLYGMPYGSLIKGKAKDKLKVVMINFILFLLPLLLFIGNVNLRYENEIAAFCAAYLITRALKWKLPML